MKTCIVITGGGTGGHVFPALAVSEILSAEENWDFAWIGETRGVERSLVRRWGMKFYGIPAGKLRRYFSLRNTWDVFRTLAGFFRALGILRRLKPVLVFSKGGFVSVPPVLAARVLRIPVISHESDVDPGLATRINGRFSRKICVPYEQSLRYYSPKKAVCTGNPVRQEILSGSAAKAYELCGFSTDDSRPLLLVVGGSLGARQLNTFIWKHLDELLGVFRIIHQTGKTDEAPPCPKASGYFPQEFFPATYPHVLAAADLVLSRAGANSVWELAACNKPAVFVPLVAGSRGDQILNAGLCAEAGAALVWNPYKNSRTPSAVDLLRQEDELLQDLKALALDPEKRRRMAEAWKKVFTQDGAAKIAQVIQEELKQQA